MRKGQTIGDLITQTIAEAQKKATQTHTEVDKQGEYVYPSMNAYMAEANRQKVNNQNVPYTNDPGKVITEVNTKAGKETTQVGSPTSTHPVDAILRASQSTINTAVAIQHAIWAGSGPHVITERDLLTDKLNSGQGNTADKITYVEGQALSKIPGLGSWIDQRFLGRGVQQIPEPDWRKSIEQREDDRKKEVKRLEDIKNMEQKQDWNTLRDVPGVGVVLSVLDKVIPDLPEQRGMLYELWLSLLDILIPVFEGITRKKWTREETGQVVEVAGAIYLTVQFVLPFVTAIGAVV